LKIFLVMAWDTAIIVGTLFEVVTI